MHRRLTTHVTTGVGGPPALEEQSHALIPILGKALFARAAKTAVRLARREFALVLSQVRSNPDRELKRQASLWFVVEKLIESLATEANAGLPASNRALTRHALQVDDPWGAFSVLGAWQLRECSTTRMSPQAMPTTPTRSARKLKKKRSRVTRATILSLVTAYEARRTPPSVTFPENQKRNDPLARFHEEALSKSLVKHQSAAPRAFPGLVRTDLETVEWARHSSFFLGIPFEPRLGLALSMLLRLRSDHTVWTHRLDFTIEPMLRLIVREARRGELGRLLNALDDVELAALAQSIRETCTYGTSMELSDHLTVGTSAVVPPKDLLDRVQAAASKHVLLDAGVLKQVVSAVGGDAFDRAAHDLMAKWLLAITNELRQEQNPPESLEFAEAPAFTSPTASDGDKLMNTLLASLPSQHQDAVFRAKDDITSLEETSSAEVARHFRSPPTWTVALPIDSWSLASPNATSMAAVASILTISELETRWQPVAELAPAAGPRGALSKATVCLVATGIRAPDEQLAVREAQSRLDSTLCGIWFLDARSYRAQLATAAFVRRETDGRVTGVRIEPSHLFLSRVVRPEEVSILAEVASELAERWSEPHQQDMWRRVSEGMGFLRSALSATLFYERYLFLWMALEALLNNLAIDQEEKYARAAPIGTRVAYRAALLLVPDPFMVGRTYGEARWVTTLELGALYHLRNKAVHEGRRNPPMDEILLDRFQRNVVAVFETVAHNAFRYGMRSVEELLAWCESKFPEADPIR